MDQFDGRMRRMAAIDAIGGALAGDSAVTGSLVNEHAFTLFIADGRVLAFALDGDNVIPYSLTSSAATVARELLTPREAETEKWDGLVLRLDRSASRLGMDFLYEADALRIDPGTNSLADIASEVRLTR